MTSEFDREIEAQGMEDQRAIVSLLLPLFEARQAKNEASKDDAKISPRVKQYLELHRDNLDQTDRGAPLITDNEHGILAYLTSSKTTSWNVSKMPDDLVLWLARVGLVTVATTAFDERRKNDPDTHLDAALHYRTEGEQIVLRVERAK